MHYRCSEEPVYTELPRSLVTRGMPVSTPLLDRIIHLVDGQRFGVLCLGHSETAYGALVAFARGDSLERLYFSTPITTRKYRFLVGSAAVAFVVDDRSERGDDLMSVSAVTILGRACELASGPELEDARARLIRRHPEMHAYLDALSSAVFAVGVTRAIHVTRFQDVEEWSPPGAA